MTLRMYTTTTPFRRLRRLDVSASFLLELLRGFDGTQAPIVGTTVPEDARVVGVTVGERLDTISIYVESAAFALVIADGHVPLWDINLSTWFLSSEERTRQQEQQALGYWPTLKTAETA